MSDTRPRSVVGAFSCWIVAAVLIAAAGLLFIGNAGGQLASYVVGVLLLLIGLALAFLADRARKGDARFARAALALAMAAVAFLGLLLFIVMVPFVALLIVLIVVLLVIGSVLNQKRESQRWYGEHEPGANA